MGAICEVQQCLKWCVKQGEEERANVTKMAMAAKKWRNKFESQTKETNKAHDKLNGESKSKFLKSENENKNSGHLFQSFE